MGITLLKNWRVSFTACCRKSKNLSHFPAVDEKVFISGTHIMTALNKVEGHYLRTEVRRDARRSLEEFGNCVLSTIASRSVKRQGMSCFFPAIVVVGDEVVLFQLFNKLLDGILEKKWTRGSEIEACRAEYQSFVQDQRQLERSCTRSRPDEGDVLSFCSAQVGFCACQHLYKMYASYPLKHAVLTSMSRFVFLMRFCCFRYSS